MRLTEKYDDGSYGIKKVDCEVEKKLGQLEDIEDRLAKYSEIGITGLVDLFNHLTDEDIEYIVQMSFKISRLYRVWWCDLWSISSSTTTSTKLQE